MSTAVMRMRAALKSSESVAAGDPLTRLRGICPRCGNRALHFYPQGDLPGHQVFLWCECGHQDFVDRHDELVELAWPFRPRMFANGYFRGLARKPPGCSQCGSTNVELLDTPDPNSAHVACKECGYLDVIHAPIRVRRRGWDAEEQAAFRAELRAAAQRARAPADDALGETSDESSRGREDDSVVRFPIRVQPDDEAAAGRKKGVIMHFKPRHAGSLRAGYERSPEP